MITTEIMILKEINYYKNDPKKSSRFNFHHQMLTQTI